MRVHKKTNSYRKQRFPGGRVLSLAVLTLFFALAVYTPVSIEAQATAAKKNYPPKFDYRDVDGCDYVTGIKDQQDHLCNSCVAFAVAGAVEITARVEMKLPLKCRNNKFPGPRDRKFSDLSISNLFFCNTNCYMGWMVKNALAYCMDPGVPPRMTCPVYKDIMADCQKRGEDPCNLSDRKKFQVDCCHTWDNTVTIIKDYATLTDRDKMKEWLANKGPLVASMYCTVNFIKNYNGGVYECPEGMLGPQNHMVCCIGYDDEKQAWLFKNSFGKEWGIDGCFWIGYGKCGIDQVMFGIDGFKQIYTTPRITKKAASAAPPAAN